MIGYLRGTLLRHSPERVLLDVNGVGYDIHVSLATYSEIERSNPAEPIALHIHTHLRDDGITLFGFWREAERTLFERLIQVSGIGPRLARAILSGGPIEERVAAIAGADIVQLSRTPGVGKKTAQRLVLELRDKVADLSAELSAQPVTSKPTSPRDGDLVSALVNLGYKPQVAERAVQEARREAPEAPFHEVLRLSLQRLSRSRS